ncbi:GNAT family N-acetyltransferase [Xinfangfangia sp. D13-10-4-6]|uniref:GNAT family N-acetyltransferase n=1 Tax=Pseudogemmobacter hezensis TaxID=2737662 RepID=UPI001552F1AC|nr:GNAT family N-acetyltransferase [Pseudogemmobacter hezensis]NPD16875.1 GNAT family N-acetyltransferase [Pseudogemmobacter hezensis]
MSLSVRALTGAELEAALDDMARLRITVFRDWPYLYDGTLDYERGYLQAYRDSPGALLVAALDGDRIVGASTSAPMEDHASEFAAPVRQSGLALENILYGAESVLLPEYRGRGIGHRFFDLREVHARALGRSHVAFCSVIRPEDHPLRPEAYRGNDAFWQKRGYAPLPGAIAHFTWRDIDQPTDSEKPLQFWMREV